MSKNQSDILLTLDKGLQVITHLSIINRPISIGELSKEVGINKTILFRILKTLKGRGFVFQHDNGKYGLRAEEFNIIVDRFDQSEVLQRILRPELEKLSEKCAETITLSVLVDEKIECIDKIDSQRSIHVTQIIGRYSPLHAAASGKAVLAFIPQSELDRLMSKSHLEKFTDYTIISTEVLEKELKEIRMSGFAVSHGELDLGISAVSAPIFSKSRKVLGSISILGVSQKFTEDIIKDLSKEVIETAGKMSALLQK